MDLSPISLVALLAAGSAWSPRPQADPDMSKPASPTTGLELPFPLKSTTLRTAGASYYIVGRMRLPHNQSIVSLRHLTLIGRGERPVLEVAGKLELKENLDGQNKINNLLIEVMPSCKGLSITHGIFSGTGGLSSSAEGPNEAEIYLRDTQFDDSTVLTLNMAGGEFEMWESRVTTQMRIQGVTLPEKKYAKLKVTLVANKDKLGLSGGLFLDNAWEVLLRNNDFGGTHTLLANCQQLDFDGNNISSQLFEVTQRDPKNFKKTTIDNCDFRGPAIRIFAPADPKKPDKLERLGINNCWFQGFTDPDEIRQKYVKDSGREPGNAMLITLKKVARRARGFGVGER